MAPFDRAHTTFYCLLSYLTLNNIVTRQYRYTQTPLDGIGRAYAYHLAAKIDDIPRNKIENYCKLNVVCGFSMQFFMWFSIGKEDHLHSRRVNFHNLGLWGSDTVNDKKWTLNKLSTIRSKLGHKQVTPKCQYAAE